MILFKTLRARFLLVGPLILALLFVLHWTSFGGHWFRWAVLGIAIAWVISLIRVVQALVLAGGIAALVTYFRRKR